MKSSNLKSLSQPFNFYHKFFTPLISSTNPNFIFHRVISLKIRPLVINPTKKAFKKYKPTSLFSRFYGRPLILRYFLNISSPAHVDQVRNSPSNKYHIPDMKIYEILQERISDGVLFL